VTFCKTGGGTHSSPHHHYRRACRHGSVVDKALQKNSHIADDHGKKLLLLVKIFIKIVRSLYTRTFGYLAP
jgi:hypothetical protein